MDPHTFSPLDMDPEGKQLINARKLLTIVIYYYSKQLKMGEKIQLSVLIGVNYSKL